MAKRIYLVISEAEGEKARLVKASSQAQAIHHVVANRYTAEVATQEGLVGALGSGLKVEEAGE